MKNILYLSKNFKIKDADGIFYNVTNITSSFIVLDDRIALTYQQFKKYFKVDKVVVY